MMTQTDRMHVMIYNETDLRSCIFFTYRKASAWLQGQKIVVRDDLGKEHTCMILCENMNCMNGKYTVLVHNMVVAIDEVMVGKFKR